MKAAIFILCLLQQSADTLFRLGLRHYSADQFDRAEDYLKQAVQTDPLSFRARFLLGATLVRLNKIADAIRELRLAHQASPRNLDVVKLLASQYLAESYFEEAAQLLTGVANPDVEVFLLLVEAHQSRGDTAGSRRLAWQASQQFPQSVGLACWMSFHLQFAGNYSQSREWLEKAIQLDAAYQASYYLMGDLFLKQGDYAQAASYFRAAIERKPDDVESRIGLGRALIGSDDLESALAELQAAAKLTPQDARVHLQMSRLYLRRGDREAAASEAAQSVRLKAANPAAFDTPASLRFGSR